MGKVSCKCILALHTIYCIHTIIPYIDSGNISIRELNFVSTETFNLRGRIRISKASRKFPCNN